MRGDLSIASARSPYRRAGLAWPTLSPVELHITALDGARLLRLMSDPVLTIRIDDGNGNLNILPSPPEAVAVEDAQQLIDSFADFAPEAVEPALEGDALTAELDRLREVEKAYQADRQAIADQGFQSLDALTSAWAEDRVALSDRTAELESSQASAAQLLVTIAGFQEQVETLNTDAKARRATAEQLEARIAELEANVAKPKAKITKAADTAEG